ncbi:drug/metabolite transporter (DMT)-like permease [Sphingomonas jejuensis]|uniref:Drug/metabolite transporter (DMT)-like permease n=1 Tax=Sphingomonas jejuensis TaxID=904715 RepID=A0ABX0XI83_9SPHN|nr:DMT family transporter [Sphingomonas jejuensis]NJC32873.1 drug/metabolite transporter (DMT)-like permease [Sphingomonas jejuensis]
MPAPVQIAARPDRRLAGIAVRLLSAICLSAMFALGKLAADRGVSVVEILFYRQAFAIPMVGAWIALSGGGMAALRTHRPGAHVWRTAIGLSGMALNFTTFLLLPLAEATVIGFSVPIFATILSTLLLAEPTGRHRWSAVLVGFAGVVLAIRPGSGALPAAGIAVGVAGAIVTAGVSITLRQIGRTEGAPTTVAWFTGLSMIPLGLLMLRFGQMHDARTWAVLAALGATGGIAQLALTASLRMAPVSVVLPMDYSSLIWAVLIGWLVFGTLPAGTTWLGAPLVILSGLYIIYREHRLLRERSSLAGPAD